MKTIRNITINALLIITLTASVAFAEGDMGSGGKTCPNGQTVCLTGDMGSGGLNGDMGSGGVTADSKSYLEWVWEYIEIFS